MALSDTKTFGTNAVNEFHFTYMRDANDLGKRRQAWGLRWLRRDL